MQTIVNDLMQKIVSRLVREFPIEMYDDRLLDAEHLEISKPLIERLKQRRCGFRMKDRARMRVERDRCRHSTDLGSAVDNGLHYFLMPEMKAVKNTQGQYRGLLNIRVLCAVKYLHLASCQGV